jgi:hypothetical protein
VESGELRVETWRRGLVDCAAGESISADCCLESCRERECVCVCVLCVCVCLHVSVCSSVARTEHRGQRREDEDKERETTAAKKLTKAEKRRDGIKCWEFRVLIRASSERPPF